VVGGRRRGHGGRRRSGRSHGQRSTGPLNRFPRGRIFLSPPLLSGEEAELLRDALESNWIAPLGPHVDAFESELAARVDVPNAVALSSGTAALHLALRLSGVETGDEVLCSTLTFAASANAIVYLGARPVFIDCDRKSWNLDPELVREELAERAAAGRLPRALVAVDLYGQCADYDALEELCDEHGVALIEDAAEALGADYRGRPAGGFGRFGVISFNGNKIVTTSGGGALLTHDREAAERARYLASQARDTEPHFEHSTIGYNYRLSNLLAAVGRAQLGVLDDRVAGRRRTFERYAERLADLDGLELMPEAPWGRANRWLTCITLDPERFGADREAVRLALEAENIEARPLWKPMHLQPVFADCMVRGGAVSAHLFDTGLCLPSGPALTADDVDRIATIVRRTAHTP
jgi:pyridoxal phosphate-dependent aminotransferase EpsN